MKTRKIIFTLNLLFASFLFCQAQTRIVKDSLLFSYSKTQLDSLYNAQGIPPSILGIKYGVKGYKVIYNTLNYDSSATTASGLLMVPDAAEYCKLPVVSYQHGTSVRRKDVPSRLVGSEKLISLALASGGMISCMPDYHGMGDGPGYHPYQNARTEAFSVIDIIRAAKEHCDSISQGYSDQLFLVGYSQGGHATMAAHKMIQEQLSTEMHVTASAPMSGAYDMSGIQTNLLLQEKPYSDPYYLPYLIFGNNPIYHFFNTPSDVLKAPYATDLPPLMNGIAGANTINAKMNDTVKRIFRDDLLDSFTNNPNHFFRVFLRDNDVYQWVPTSPVKMYFCSLDEKVPFQNSYVAYDYFLTHGCTLTDTVNSGAMMHTDCAQPSLISAKFWLDSLKDVPINVSANYLNASPKNSNDGEVHLSITGGRSPYTVTWDNSLNGADITGLIPGTYSYTIVDANNCSKSGSVQIGLSNGIENLARNQVKLYPNPASESITIFVDENFNTQIPVSVINILGQEMKSFEMKNKIQTENISDLPHGVYTIKIGKTYTQQFIKQ